MSVDPKHVSAYAVYNKQKIQKQSKKNKRKSSKPQRAESNTSGSSTTNILMRANRLVSPRAHKAVKALKKQNTTTGKKTSKSDPLSALEFLLDPIKPSEFFESCWETQPFYVGRPNKSHYKHLLSTKTLDSMLRQHPLYFTRNVDVVSYENGRRETHNPEGRAVPSAVFDYYMNGCSVRILNPQTYNKKIRMLLSCLQEYFGTMVGANVYLTPAGSQGFAPHYDDIEAFVLQLEGRKHWKLYKPKNPNEFLARDSSHNLSREELGEPIEQITLEAGSMLYFPRGMVHEAKTDENSHSLHLTVSVYQHTSYADLLEKAFPVAIKKAVSQDLEFRRGLPINYLKHAGVVNKNKQTVERSRLKKKVQLLMHRLVDFLDVDDAADQMGRKFMYDAVPPVYYGKVLKHSVKGDGERMENGKVLNRVEFTPDTLVRLLTYHSARLVVENDQPRIYYCTENSKIYHEEDEQFLEIDGSIIPAIERLFNAFPKYVAVESLPIEDHALKFQTVADLWERGILVTSEPLNCIDDD